jgi:hypothetical protein
MNLRDGSVYMGDATLQKFFAELRQQADRYPNNIRDIIRRTANPRVLASCLVRLNNMPGKFTDDVLNKPNHWQLSEERIHDVMRQHQEFRIDDRVAVELLADQYGEYLRTIGR